MGEFAARRTLYDSLSKDNSPGRPVRRTDLWDSDRAFDDFQLALLAEKWRHGLAPVAAATTICRTTFCYPGANRGHLAWCDATAKQ
jgi:hypothetical protein